MTMTLYKPALIALALVLSACGGTPDRYPIATDTVTGSQRIGFGSVEVRKVSLPTYAAADEIAIQDETGKLISESNVLWADSPERAVTIELARHLSQLTKARIASEPWPLEALPDARLEIRFEQLIAGSDGQFRAVGQYFVAVLDGGRERSGLFSLTVPFDIEGGPQAITAARGQVIVDLAKYVARNGLR